MVWVCVCVCKRACVRAASVQQSQQPGESAQLHSRLERHARRLLSQAAQAAWGEVKGRSVSKRCSWPSRSRVLGPLCRQWKGAGENWKLRGSSHMTLFLLVGSPLDSQWWESQGVGFAVGVFRWASWNVNSVEGGGLLAPPSQINSCQWPPGWTREGNTLAWKKC